MRRDRTVRVRGYTLVELVLGLAVTSVLLTGMASALLIASRAANPTGPTPKILTGSRAVQDILNELHYALTFTERSANAVEFTVADRNGDALPDTIRYAWSGIAGDPLTRQYNGGTVVTVAEDVHDFSLDYRTRTVSSPPSEGGSTSAPVFEEFAEAKLTSTAEAIGVSKPGGTSAGDLLIAAVVWDSKQTRSHSAPGGWNLVVTEEGGASVEFAVWWKVAGGSEPSNYQFTWVTSELAYGWIMRFTGHDAANPIHAFSFDSSSSTSPTCPAVTSTVDNALILRLGAFDAPDITVDSPGLPGHTAITMDTTGTGSGDVSGGAGYVAQATAGDSGTSDFTLTANEESVTVTIAITPDPGGGGGGGSDQYYNVSVDVRLQVGDDSASRVDGAIEVLNAPEVSGP